MGAKGWGVLAIKAVNAETVFVWSSSSVLRRQEGQLKSGIAGRLWRSAGLALGRSRDRGGRRMASVPPDP